MRLEFSKEDVGWNLEEDIRDEEYHQRGVVLCSLYHVQVISHSENSGISDVDPVSWIHLVRGLTLMKD